MQTSLQVYELAVVRGLKFYRVGPGDVGISGPSNVLTEMNDIIDQHADGLVALTEEFSGPVASAEAILKCACRPTALTTQV
jgi:hypothetical protein